MSNPRCSVVVLGPGGVGLLLGAVLSRAGHSIFHVATPVTAATLAAGGVTLTSSRFGNFVTSGTAGSTTRGPVDVCLVTVKATDLDSALDRVRTEDLGDALVVPLLNGIEHMRLLRTRFPPEQVVAGTIRVEAERTAPGQVHQRTPFARIEVASRPAAPERVEELASPLRLAGLDVSVRDDETAMLWRKLIFFAPLALLTTYTRSPIGEVRTAHGEQLRAVVSEPAQVAAAEGVPADPAAVLETLDSTPEHMKSSMLRDAETGKPTELDAIGGAILRAARRHGLGLPVTERIVKELRAPMLAVLPAFRR